MGKIKNWFTPSAKTIATLVETRFPAAYSYICNIGANQESKRRAESYKKMQDAVFVCNHEIGTPIIAVPNEHENMIIGFVVAHETITQANTPVAIVYDYVRDTELMLLPKAYPFSESFARTVSNLHPDDRHILFYGHEKNFSSIDENTIIGWEDMKKRLNDTGFFEKLNQHALEVKKDLEIE
ncbi:hypothetical protein OTK49_03125 [Vibrio coralliirubri]|uniref:hypothetical protein n=1 Tax=Vibrio coralliirubri TaxID=1516159 RepID=UPI00228397C0|nr:hypothetical protein [Vibrio coralliirubri]MCY9861508.1 hypothetical protein [Vibrio coralliirubri]